MVDLVKIRKKAKREAEARPAETPAAAPAPEPSHEAQPKRGRAGKRPDARADTAAPEPVAAKSPARGHDAGATPHEAAQATPDDDARATAGAAAAEPSSAAIDAQISKLDRFREQAGRLRDAIVERPETEEETATASDQLEVLSFVIAGEHYAADIERIVEIVTPRNVTKVPNTDPAIVGIVSLRGMMVTIVDIRARLRQRQVEPTAETRFIVVDQHGETIGFEVDRVLRVLKIGRSTVEPHPVVHASEIDDSILGVFRHKGALTILLDFDKLLAVGVTAL